MKGSFNKNGLCKAIALLLVFCMSFCMISCGDSNSDDFFDDEVSFDDDSRELEKDDDGKILQSGEVNNDVNVEGTVTLSCPQDIYVGSARESIRQWISAFNALYPDVKVKEDFSDRGNWSARLYAKDMGDVFWLDDTQVYDMAIARTALMPLDVYAEHFSKDTRFGLNMSDVYAGFYNLGEVDGQLYMIATNCGQQTFTYNKGMLTQAGLSMPTDDWTWSDFKEYVNILTVQNPDGSLAQVGAAMNITISPMYIPFYLGFGGQWCDTINKKITLTTDENVLRGVNELVGVLQKKQIYPTSAGIRFDGDYANAFANINADNVSTTAAFWQLDSFANLATRAAQYETADIDWDIVAFPLFDYPASPCGSFGYGVFSYASNPVAAAALCLSLYTQAGQKAINQGAVDSVPLLSSLKTETFWHLDEYADKNYDAFVANTDMYVPSQVKCEVPAAVGEIIIEGMEQLFMDLYEGAVSVEDCLAKIETQANEKWVTIR
ncbi:MAG: extracellular solute-binding protein [Clostridia bacterium]|nr:extracellular solute-binding protein [Clostridia bacterium]